MRTILAGAALMAFVVASGSGRLVKMFDQFGPPSDIQAKRGQAAEDDDVFCDYGTFGFRVRNKQIRCCFFFDEWKEPIRGIRVGGSREGVGKDLEKPRETIKDKEGAVTSYGYDLKELDADFLANFDKDGKVWRVE